MSKPITIPLTNLKRNWKFLWQIQQSQNQIASSNFGNIANTAKNIAANVKDVASTIGGFAQDAVGAFKSGGVKGALDSVLYSYNDLKTRQILSDPVLQMYVSQLAKSISLPEDEVEFENYLIGNVDYPVPVKYKVNDITVTYYDDNLDTVYNFHKWWLNLAKESGGNNGMSTMAMNPVAGLTFAAKYIVYEDSLSTLEYSYLLKWINRGMSALTSATEKVTAFFNLPDVSEAGEVVDPFLKWHSTQTFPSIFPRRIERSGPDKGGDGLSEVTVTYVRVPNFIQRPSAYVGFNSFGLD